jgi:hypothetical protein
MGSFSPSERASAPSQYWHLSNWGQSRSFEQPGETPTSHGGENYERMHSTLPSTIFRGFSNGTSCVRAERSKTKTNKERGKFALPTRWGNENEHTRSQKMQEKPKKQVRAQAVLGPAYGQVHELMPQVRIVPKKFDLTFDLEVARAETPLSPTSACKCLLRPYFTVSSLSGAIRLDDSLPCSRACWKACGDGRHRMRIWRSLDCSRTHVP